MRIFRIKFSGCCNTLVFSLLKLVVTLLGKNVFPQKHNSWTIISLDKIFLVTYKNLNEGFGKGNLSE